MATCRTVFKKLRNYLIWIFRIKLISGAMVGVELTRRLYMSMPFKKKQREDAEVRINGDCSDGEENMKQVDTIEEQREEVVEVIMSHGDIQVKGILKIVSFYDEGIEKEDRGRKVQFCEENIAATSYGKIREKKDTSDEDTSSDDSDDDF